MKFRKKIFLAGLSVLLLLVATVSTTFAWFSLNDASWIDDFDMEVYSTDKLLIRHETSDYKQMLTTDDIVDAINNDRESGKIQSLDEISLTSVHSIDGTSFSKLEPSYDEMNRKSVKLVQADKNSYLMFTLTFMLETSNKEGEVHPDYKLVFSQNEEAGGIKKTSFTSENQTIKLVNKLVTPDGNKSMGDTVIVNPVNALRLSVNTPEQGIGYIYEPKNKADLGSYAIYDKLVNSLAEKEYVYSHSTNAAFTYYNNINNDILEPLGYYSNNDEEDYANKHVISLLNKLRDNLNDHLGIFKYNLETKAYNEITVTFGLWLEGFDADNLIGLDASKIKCLLSFAVEEEVNI